jgi:hypothetical protein
MRVLAVLDKAGIEPILEFDSPPRQFSVAPGEYRLYFMESWLERLDTGLCDELVGLHPMSAGFSVNGRDRYVASMQGNTAIVKVLPALR